MSKIMWYKIDTTPPEPNKPILLLNMFNYVYSGRYLDDNSGRFKLAGNDDILHHTPRATHWANIPTQGWQLFSEIKPHNKQTLLFKYKDDVVAGAYYKTYKDRFITVFGEEYNKIEYWQPLPQLPEW